MMLDRQLFASFDTLQDERDRAKPLGIGASISLVAHALFFVVLYSVTLGPSWLWEVKLEDQLGGGGRRGEIVEVAGRPLILPPEVIERLLSEPPPVEPLRADFIARTGSVARGESNPNPVGSSPVPRSSGEGTDVSSATQGSGSEESSAANTQSEDSIGPERRTRDRNVLEATDRLPTVTDRTPSTSPDSRRSDRAGQGTEIARAGVPPGEPSQGLNNQDSGIVIRGPVSLNTRGVGMLEEYRAYLEQAIQRRWQIPPEANLLQRSVGLTVEFSVTRDGRLVSVRLYDSTGIRALDRAAQRAIELAAPFRPLPSIFPGQTQVFTDTFVYYPPP